MNKDLIVACPTCKKSIRWQDGETYRPFCSKRCQLIDLGEWASESHKIEGPPLHEDEDSAAE